MKFTVETAIKEQIKVLLDLQKQRNLLEEEMNDLMERQQNFTNLVIKGNYKFSFMDSYIRKELNDLRIKLCEKRGE